MSPLLQYAVAGLSAGSLYALVALGLVLIHRSTRILNFAHGDVAAFGTFVAFRLLSHGVPLVVAIGCGIGAGVLVAIGFYFAVLQPAQRRGARTATLFILTLGLSQILQGVILQVFGAEPERFPLPVSEIATLRLGPVVVSHLALVVLSVAVVCSAALFALVQRTRLGLALRAISENLTAGQTLGLPTRGILALAWGLASALAVVAGILLASTLYLDPFFMLEPSLKGFAAAVLGGLESLPGAVAGGLLLGLAEGLGGAYLGLPFKNSLGFLVIVVVLLVRPEGLFGGEFE